MKSINLLGATLLASTALLGAGNVFAKDSSTPDPNSASTPVEVTLSPRDVTDEVPTPPKPEPDNPNNPGGGDNNTGITGPFGIAYAPAKLVQKEQTVELGKSANQMVNLKSSKGDTVTNLNVGVRDETAKTGRHWTLSAQLQWTGSSPLAGSSIEAQGTGNVTENISGTLNSTDKINNDVTGSLSIRTDGPTSIMTAKNDKVMSGTYNYQFKMPQLKIADPTVVAAGTYTGNIVWNLSDAM
ncbi:WxL domain-containing protein [Enterococcus faecalis]|uniref:WxL domain-containing protein n=1 Tax=Enterococcus faecalis TaxID=1351 RepID=UPI001D0BBEEE|nr:WxL domain-containing protein [Enterococcus faecalis]MCB8511724.1 WxL domain-containing protein [Enterococcus faecalis]